MRILLITGIFEPEIGGPATYTARLGKKLVALGHTVKVITYSNEARFDFDSEYPFALVRVVRRGKLSNYFKFFLAVLKNIRNFDVVYSFDWVSAGLPLRLASLLTGKKYAVRVGGGYIWEKYLAEGRSPVTLKDFYQTGLYGDYPVLYRIIKFVLRGAEFVVFNSAKQADLYQTFYHVDDSRVKVIPNPTPENFSFGVTRDETRINNEIVFAGRFIKMKNIEVAIEAFTRVKNTSSKLVLIGEGPTEKSLRALVKKLGISDRVSFEPSMLQKDLYQRIIQCHYVILPSWTDISPNQIYECLALGIPFLMTKENYLTINQEDFLKIDPASVDDVALKMNSLSDAGTYKAFTDRLKQIKFSYSWDDATRDHEALFKKLI
ncbi:MAG: glycosyltransferase family 4 protein [Patescibacteria group bacterium]